MDGSAAELNVTDLIGREESMREYFAFSLFIHSRYARMCLSEYHLSSLTGRSHVSTCRVSNWMMAKMYALKSTKIHRLRN